MRVLVVEDDRLLGDGICAGLRQDGYGVDWVTRGALAEQALLSEAYDLVVLDLGLPDIDGLKVLANVRERGDATPVLILTARDALADRVQGLDRGADDYLVKPFDLDELSARARALLRRSRGRANPMLEYKGLRLDPAAHRVDFDAREVDLSPREFSVLRVLLESAGRVVAKRRLQESIYGWDQDIESNAVEVHIHNLRKKLSRELIQTVRGVGYMLARKG